MNRKEYGLLVEGWRKFLNEDESMKFGFSNVFNLSLEEASQLLERPECCKEIEDLSKSENSIIAITDKDVKIPFRMNNNDYAKTHFVVLEYDSNKGWSIMWRYADTARRSYTNDISSYIAGKTLYRGCKLNRPKIIDFINGSGYEYHPSLERS